MKLLTLVKEIEKINSNIEVLIEDIGFSSKLTMKNSFCLYNSDLMFFDDILFKVSDYSPSFHLSAFIVKQIKINEKDYYVFYGNNSNIIELNLMSSFYHSLNIENVNDFSFLSENLQEKIRQKITRYCTIYDLEKYDDKYPFIKNYNYIKTDDCEMYLKNGKLHNLKGPSHITSTYKYYYINGFHHKTSYNSKPYSDKEWQQYCKLLPFV